MERLIDLARKRGCEAAEVYSAAATRTPVEYESGQLKQIQTIESSVIALRVIKNGRLGFATSTKEGDYVTLVDDAVATAQLGTEATFGFAEPAVMPKVSSYDPAIADLPIERMVAAGSAMIEAIQAYEPRISAQASVEKGIVAVRILTSSGVDANYRVSDYAVSAGGDLVQGDSLLHCHDQESSARLPLDAQTVVTSALEKFRLARVNRPIASGKHAAILTPVGLRQCLIPLTASIEGLAVWKGLSPWKDSLGRTVAASNITVYDDGLLDWTAQTVPFDAEGTPHQRTPIIEHGILRHFLLDRRAAAALGRAPTGNAVRGIDTPPSIAPTTLVMEPGDADLATMVSGIREGVIIDELMGTWAGNPYSGMVNGNIALGYRVEHGEITGRVKDCMLSLNLFDVLQHQIVAISKERLNRGRLLPWVLVDGAAITTRD